MVPFGKEGTNGAALWFSLAGVDDAMGGCSPEVVSSMDKWNASRQVAVFLWGKAGPEACSPHES